MTTAPTLGEVLAREDVLIAADVPCIAEHQIFRHMLADSFYGIDGKGGLVERVEARAEAMKGIASRYAAWQVLEALQAELEGSVGEGEGAGDRSR